MAGIATKVPIELLADEIATISADMAVSSTRPLMSQFFNYLTGKTKRRIAQGVDPNGVPWKPLAMPRTRPRDKAKNTMPDGSPQGKQKPLYDTGILLSSISVAGAKGSVTQIGEANLIYGTNIHYAGYHQEGTGPIRPTKKKALWWKGALHPVMSTKGIPARPFLGVTERDADMLVVLTLRFFESGGRQSG